MGNGQVWEFGLRPAGSGKEVGARNMGGSKKGEVHPEWWWGKTSDEKRKKES